MLFNFSTLPLGARFFAWLALHLPPAYASWWGHWFSHFPTLTRFLLPKRKKKKKKKLPNTSVFSLDLALCSHIRYSVGKGLGNPPEKYLFILVS